MCRSLHGLEDIERAMMTGATGAVAQFGLGKTLHGVLAFDQALKGRSPGIDIPL